MFRSKIRIHTCRVILLTSLVWFLVDVVVLTFYSDCLSGNCKRSNEYDVEIDSSKLIPEDDNQVREPAAFHQSEEASRYFIYSLFSTRLYYSHILFSRGHYKSSQLRRWKPAPVVVEQYGSPGEMGKAVHIPQEKEEEMKAKFKLNQFNLMASDIISLNRSLADVRLPG